MAQQEQLVPSASKTRRLSIVAAFIIFAALLVAAVILATHWPFSQQKVSQSLQEDWPGSLQIAKFTRTYFPHPGFIAEDLVLHHKSVTSGRPLLVTIKKATVQANYHDLLFRPGYISRILLEGLHFQVQAQSQAGTTKESTASPNQAANSSKSQKKGSTRLGEVDMPDSVLEVAGAKEQDPFAIHFHQLTFKNVREGESMSFDLAARIPFPEGDVQAQGEIGPRTAPRIEDTHVSATYTLEHGDLGTFRGISGTLSAQGKVEGPLGHMETQGTTDTQNFHVDSSSHVLPLRSKYVAFVDGTNGDVFLKEVNAALLKTSIHFDGAIAAKEGVKGKTVTLNASVRDGHIEDLSRLFISSKTPPMEGGTSFRARISVPPGPQPFMNRVLIDGDFAMQQCSFTNPERQASANQLSKKASGNKNEKETQPVLADIKGHALLKNKVAKLTGVSYIVPSAEVDLDGTYILESEKIDFHGNLKTAAELSKDTSGIKSVLLKPLDPLFKRKHAGAVVPVTMTGTFHNPNFAVSVIPGKK